jgi:mannose/fructose/N-acetylgalactosamine-specific phosphotransferase system component IID
MNKSISTQIKIAAFFFLVGGLLNLVVAVTNLTVPSTSADPESLRGVVNQLTQIISIVSAVLSILVGWFLIKAKRWSYILGLVLVILAIIMHGLVLAQVGTTRWYGLALSATILILLIAGRKDFKKI